MTLKEKFQKVTYWWRVADEAEQIADDFAIDFLEFYREISSIMDKKYIGKTSKELLEIYKKEKKTEWYNEDKIDERIKIIGQNGNNGEHYTL